jgi:hypothetical protein
MMKWNRILAVATDRIWQHIRPRPPAWKEVGFDLLLLSALLGGLNYLVEPRSWGWISVQPSPYLLIPILMGIRYGFLPGGISGFWTGIGLGIAGSRIHEIGLIEFVRQNMYWETSFVAVGCICGEVQQWFAFQLEREEKLSEHSHRRLQQMDDEIALLREAKDEVERVLATMNSEVSLLDVEVRRLSQCQEDEFYPDLLSILNRKVRVQSAAFYHKDSNGILIRQAYIGLESDFPLQLVPGKSRAVDLAFEKKTVVTLPQVWTHDYQDCDDYLMAVPLLSAKEEALGCLVVQGIPFIAFHKRTVHTIHLICRWAVRLQNTRLRPDEEFRFVGEKSLLKVYTEPHFKSAVNLAFETYEHLHLPSSVVLFYAAQQIEEGQGSVEERLATALRAGDITTRLSPEKPHLAVFLPLTGKRGAQLCCERALNMTQSTDSSEPAIEGRVFSLEEWRNANDFWKSLHEPLKKDSK